MLADRRHGFDDHWFDPDRQQPCVGDDQRHAVPITGFAPEGVTLAEVSIDFFEPATVDHHAHDLRGGGTMQPLRQRHGNVVCALGACGQDQVLGFGEIGHGGLRSNGPRRMRALLPG